MSKDDAIRKKLKTKYYLDWQPKNNIYGAKKLENYQLIDMYNEYIIKLKDFILEVDELSKKINKKSYIPNYRQIGGYERCVKNYPDKGWNEKHMQFIQAYKELMVDFICYEPIEYDDLSLEEIKVMKEMANFLIQQAEKNKLELQ